MPKDTWSNLFILAPAKIEISFAHWGDKQIVELDFSEFSGSNSIQIISGLNGSGKTITLEAVKRYTEVFTRPSNQSIRSFINFATDVGLDYIMAEFQSLTPTVYDERYEHNDHFMIDIDNLPFGYSINASEIDSDYSKIDANRFVDYFGFELDVDQWLSFYTTISKCVKFENYDSMKWYSKQKGLVQLKHTGKSGQFDWDEGWKPIKSIHTRELLEKDLLLHISSINPDTKEWNEKFGINFEQQHYELHQADEPGSISIVRGSSYIKVKQAYSFDESFFSKLTQRLKLIRELKSKLEEGDIENFNSLYEELKKSSDISGELNSMLDRLPDFDTIGDGIEQAFDNMTPQVFVQYLSLKSPKTYMLLCSDDLSYVSLVLTFLCDGAEFLKEGASHLTAGQRRVINIAHQWYNAPRGDLLLIDEPEVSLHISWQRNLVSAFNDIHAYIADVFERAEEFSDQKIVLKEEDLSHFDIISLFLNTYSQPRKRILIATHSPDIIYHHQDSVAHIPPQGGE